MITTKMLCVGLLCAVLPATPSFSDVLNDPDNGPFTGIFGIPDSTEGGVLLTDGAQSWSLLVATSSHSIDEEEASESLLLDGQTTQYEFRYRYGLSDRLEIGVELPYVQHSSGWLDPVIERWHDIFGFRVNAREDQPEDELQFYYADSIANPLTVMKKSDGPGDLRLFAGWQLSRNEHSATAIRLGLKFATGDSKSLHGSGGTDLSLGIAGDGNRLWGLERLNGFYRVGAVYLGQPEYLAERSESLVGYLSSGLGYFVTDRIELRVQAAMRSAAYDSDMEYLGDPSTTLTFGGNIRLGKSYELSLSVAEDIDMGSAPDATFQVAFRYLGN